MAQSYNGKCHCGQTEWTAELPADAQRHVVCHCNACQVMGGGAFSLNQIIPKSNFNLTKGNLKVYSYKGDSGNSVDCFMCPNCASSPYHHQQVMGPDKIVIRTALLQGTHKWDNPAIEIFTKDKFSWQPKTGDQAVEGPPPS